MHEQVVIDGHGTYDELGLELISAPTLSPPELNTVFVDVPGGAPIDLTEYSGDATYGKREQDFEFVMSGREPDDIEVEKTQLSKLLHGLRGDFTLSWDPGYTYTGRWWVKKYPNSYHVGTITLHVQAEPWKSGGTSVYRINGAGGIRVSLPSGRRTVQPTVECYRTTVISLDGADWTLEPGTWVLPDLWFHSGDNILAVDTTPEYGISIWSGFSDTWAAHDGMWAAMAAGDQPLQQSLLWSDVTDTWWDHETAKWIDMCHPMSTEDETYNIYIAYEIKEL